MTQQINAMKVAEARFRVFSKKYRAFFKSFVTKSYHGLISAIKERTPVDYGFLRTAFSSSSRVDFFERGAMITIDAKGSKGTDEVSGAVRNPADYAAHVEYGYDQRPNMIIKMKFVRGRYRFAGYFGMSKGRKNDDDEERDPEPDEFVFVTKARHIPGRFMVRNSITEMMTELPRNYGKAFGAFRRTNGWIN